MKGHEKEDLMEVTTLKMVVLGEECCFAKKLDNLLLTSW